MELPNFCNKYFNIPRNIYIFASENIVIYMPSNIKKLQKGIRGIPRSVQHQNSNPPGKQDLWTPLIQKKDEPRQTTIYYKHNN